MLYTFQWDYSVDGSWSIYVSVDKFVVSDSVE